jgi:hypothetical protein
MSEPHAAKLRHAEPGRLPPLRLASSSAGAGRLLAAEGGLAVIPAIQNSEGGESIGVSSSTHSGGAVAQLQGANEQERELPSTGARNPSSKAAEPLSGRTSIAAKFCCQKDCYAFWRLQEFYDKSGPLPKRDLFWYRILAGTIVATIAGVVTAALRLVNLNLIQLSVIFQLPRVVVHLCLATITYGVFSRIYFVNAMDSFHVERVWMPGKRISSRFHVRNVLILVGACGTWIALHLFMLSTFELGWHPVQLAYLRSGFRQDISACFEMGTPCVVALVSVCLGWRPSKHIPPLRISQQLGGLVGGHSPKRWDKIRILSALWMAESVLLFAVVLALPLQLLLAPDQVQFCAIIVAILALSFSIAVFVTPLEVLMQVVRISIFPSLVFIWEVSFLFYVCGFAIPLYAGLLVEFSGSFQLFALFGYSVWIDFQLYAVDKMVTAIMTAFDASYRLRFISMLAFRMFDTAMDLVILPNASSHGNMNTKGAAETNVSTSVLVFFLFRIFYATARHLHMDRFLSRWVWVGCKRFHSVLMTSFRSKAVRLLWGSGVEPADPVPHKPSGAIAGSSNKGPEATSATNAAIPGPVPSSNEDGMNGRTDQDGEPQTVSRKSSGSQPPKYLTDSCKIEPRTNALVPNSCTFHQRTLDFVEVEMIEEAKVTTFLYVVVLFLILHTCLHVGRNILQEFPWRQRQRNGPWEPFSSLRGFGDPYMVVLYTALAAGLVQIGLFHFVRRFNIQRFCLPANKEWMRAGKNRFWQINVNHFLDGLLVRMDPWLQGLSADQVKPTAEDQDEELDHTTSGDSADVRASVVGLRLATSPPNPTDIKLAGKDEGVKLSGFIKSSAVLDSGQNVGFMQRPSSAKFASVFKIGRLALFGCRKNTFVHFACSAVVCIVLVTVFDISPRTYFRDQWIGINQTEAAPSCVLFQEPPPSMVLVNRTNSGGQVSLFPRKYIDWRSKNSSMNEFHDCYFSLEFNQDLQHAMAPVLFFLKILTALTQNHTPTPTPMQTASMRRTRIGIHSNLRQLDQVQEVSLSSAQ